VNQVFRAKLQIHASADALPRPRLLSQVGFPTAGRMLIVQAPAGAGKTTFLAQWLSKCGGPFVCYTLDRQDRDGQVLAAHLRTGLQEVWSGWNPPAAAGGEPGALAVALVEEAARRPPLTLVLDCLEWAFGRPYIADFLAAVLRYAPTTLTLVLSSRAPLPMDLETSRYSVRLVSAAELAFTQDEATALLGEGDWQDCLHATGGLPLALMLWRQADRPWRAVLGAHMVAELPPHIRPETGRALVEEWLNGRLTLAAFAEHLTQKQPGATERWRDLAEVRTAWENGDNEQARRLLEPLWAAARGIGDPKLMGAVAILWGNYHYSCGTFGQAMEWYRRAFEADPILETVGGHTMIFILKEQGFLAEAEALGRRCLRALADWGDLWALFWVHLQYGAVCADLGRLDEAARHYREAERISTTFAVEPGGVAVARIHLAMVELAQGNTAAFRRTVEEGYAAARGRSPWLRAICAYMLGGALARWGDVEAAERLLEESAESLLRLGCGWHAHAALVLRACVLWQQGNAEAARPFFDEALGRAAAEGYVQFFMRWAPAQPLIADALVRGAHAPFCHELLVRIGERALPTLLDLAVRPDPPARRAALYPLSAIGGEKALEVIRRLLHDDDEAVRDRALLALQSLGKASPEQSPPDAGAAGEPPALNAALLGPMAVWVMGKPVVAWRTVKTRDMLAYLLLNGHRPVTLDQMAESLWPELDPEAARSVVHTTLYYLRRAVTYGRRSLIVFAGGAYRLELSAVALDLDRFAKQAAAGGEAGWRGAVELYRGDLLEGLEYAWIDAPRIRARNQYLEALRLLAGHLGQTGRHGDALNFLQLRVQADPLSEDAHVQLMRCHAALGNRSAALYQYQALARLLDEELGLEPGVEAQALYRNLLN